jgi:hypothetical protein
MPVKIAGAMSQMRFKSSLMSRRHQWQAGKDTGEASVGKVPNPQASSELSCGSGETQSSTSKPMTKHVECPLLEELLMHEAPFDPLHPCVKSVLLAKLRLSEAATIQECPDNSGSFNNGVWFVFDCTASGTSKFVLKQVRNYRILPDMATDTEKFLKLQRQHPDIRSESMITFPCNIFELVSIDGTKDSDLIVMRKATGLQITQHLFYKFQREQTDQLLDIFKRFGTFMRRFHQSYNGMQHGDCSPSNVFYDDVSGNFTLIDVADFGYGPYLAVGGENDVEHFIDGLKTLSSWYGSVFLSTCEDEFRNAYMAGVL